MRRVPGGSARFARSTVSAAVAGLLGALVAAAPGWAAGPIDPALLAGMKARSIGPAGMSGRVAVIEAVESDPDVVYAGAATGGVWKSTNGGLTWHSTFDDQPVAAIGALAVFQPNPDILWVGTGEGNVRNSASVGNGVYLSTDGGRTWQHRGLEKTERIYRLLAHPTDPEVAYACAPGQEWGENPDRGVFKTTDGGRSWQKVLYVDERTGCGDLAMDLSNPHKLFAGMWQFRRWPYFFRSGGPGSGLYLTHDGGTTWRKLLPEDGLPEGDLGRIGLAVSRSHPNVVYALVEAEKSALVRSEDGGRSWKTVNDRWDVAPRPFYFGDLRVDPKWPDRVYSLDYVVRVSDDGGKTFETLVQWDLIHGDYHAMWIDPGDPERFYVGNDGGIAVSHDHGRTSRFVGNLPVAQYYHVAVDGERPYHVYGGMQDNSSWRGPSAVWEGGGIRNHHWKLVGGGDGYDTLPDPENAETGYSMAQGGWLTRWNLATGEWRDVRPPAPAGAMLRFNWNTGIAIDPFEPATIYYGSQFVHRSRDRGESWEVISPDLTTDNPAWQRQAESGGLTPDVTAAENHCTILAIAPSPRQRGVLWVGTDDGRVQVTRDGGATWTSVEGNVRGAPANTWVPHIEASPHGAGTAFLILDDHRRSNWKPYVFRTDDFGKTWRSLATSELRGYALSIEQDPVDPDLLFLGTEFGLWVSLDGGRGWLPWKHGLPTVSVMDLVIHPREHDLVLGTHGRSAYVLDDIRPLRELSAAVTEEPLHLFEIAPAQQYWSAPEAGGFGLGSGEFRGENRPYGALVTFWLSGSDLPLPDPEKERERKEAERARERAKRGEEWVPRGPEAKGEETAGTAEVVGGEKASAQPGKPSEKDKVRIVVADAAGRAVRTFEVEAKRGLNRVPWGLERDAFRRPPQERPPENRFPGGPQLPPGTYRLTVQFRGHEQARTVEVLADPRSANGAADWQAREEAVARVKELNDLLVEAIERVREARADAEAAAGRAAKEKEAADRAAGRVPPAGEKAPLTEPAEALGEKLTALEKKLWVPYDTKGLVADEDAFSAVWQTGGAVFSSWAPPSLTHLARLAEAERRVAAALEEVNQVFATEVAAFRAKAEEAGIRLLPEREPLAAPR